MTAFLVAMASGDELKLVTINISMSFPARDLHNTVLLILSLF